MQQYLAIIISALDVCFLLKARLSANKDADAILFRNAADLDL